MYFFEVKDYLRDRAYAAEQAGWPRVGAVIDACTDALQFIVGKYDSVLAYTHNALFGSNRLRTGLKFGQFHETEDLMLHGMFEALVDYVEIQQAWMASMSDDEDKKLPWYVRSDLLRTFIPWRSEELGIKRLGWESKLTFGDEYPERRGELTNQAKSAQTQLELYLWWKHIRPARRDEFYMTVDELKAELEHLPKTDQFDMMQDGKGKLWLQVEWGRNAEDTAMLHKLIDIRDHLWT